MLLPAAPGCSWLLRLSLAIPGRPFLFLAAPWVFPCCSLTSLAVACPPWLVPGRSPAAPWLLPGLPDCSLAFMAPWQFLAVPGWYVCSFTPAPREGQTHLRPRVLASTLPTLPPTLSLPSKRKSGPLTKRSSAETVFCRSGTLPKRSSAAAALCQNVPRTKNKKRNPRR